MPRTKIKDVDIDGRTVPIYLTETGQFVAELNDPDDDPTASTLAGLIDKLKTRIRKARPEIPATLIDQPGWRDQQKPLVFHRITLTGIHASHRVILYRDSDGEAGRVGYGEMVCRSLTPEDEARTRELYAAHLAADDAWETHLESLKMDARKALAGDAGDAGDDDA